jgi:hypothetical protein
MKRFLFAILLSFASAARAGVHPAASLSRADVQAAMDDATEEGAIVVLPANSGGDGHWTTQVTWNAPVNATLRGAGTTTINSGTRTMSANDLTVITDDVAVSSSTNLLRINAAATGTFRMTGITFQGGAHGGIDKDNGTIIIYSGGATIRVDHCHLVFTASENSKVMVFWEGTRGVFDHNLCEFTDTRALYFVNGRQNGGLNANWEWTQPTAFGSADFFYVEDNHFIGYYDGNPSNGSKSTRVLDSWTGGKAVVRFNRLVDACAVETHATGHSSDDRGARAMEVYGNQAFSTWDYFSGLGPNRNFTDISSGTALVWGNDMGYAYGALYTMQVTRGAGQSGGGPYNQSPTPDGWGYAGTNFNGTGSNWDGGTYNGTDTLYGYPSIDQPGRGPSPENQILTGSFPSKVNSLYGIIRWPNQALEPVYYWRNAGERIPGWGANIDVANDVRVTENTDFYLPNASFTGAAGVGWGTSKPSSGLTAGVAYFVEDEGDWNTSTSNPLGVDFAGSDGVLYVATSSTTWTLYYEPFTYPHPLNTSDDSPSPSYSPGKLRIKRR